MSTHDTLLNGDVWDARNGSRPDHWVAIENGTVADVSAERPGQAAVERTAETITPGLCDMHVHLVWDGSGDPVETLRNESEQETTLRAVHNAREQLRGGVTTVRDVGSVDDIAIPVSQAIEDGWIEGPRTYASGRTIIISGGHDPFWGIESDGPDACRQAVRKLRSTGAYLIKVSATGGVYGQAVGEDPGVAELSLDELTAIVEEAHRFDLDVAAHAVGREGIANAIEAGVDTVEHGNQLDADLIETLAASDTTYDPTLYVYAQIASGGDGEIPSYAQQNAQRVYEQHAEAFRTVLDTDTPLLTGSDAGSPDVPHPGLHLELQQMVAEGMDPSAALEAATLQAAKELGQPEIGVVEAGTTADLVCFDTDPKSEIAAVANPTHVIKDGGLVD
jgi:imidazolonepropionase-like amidohydrolase